VLAVEEPRAEMLLELADLVADRAGRDAELGGGGGETQEATGGLEGTQAAQRGQAGADGAVPG
jgi:hypothetical protein